MNHNQILPRFAERIAQFCAPNNDEYLRKAIEYVVAALSAAGKRWEQLNVDRAGQAASWNRIIKEEDKDVRVVTENLNLAVARFVPAWKTAVLLVLFDQTLPEERAVKNTALPSDGSLFEHVMTKDLPAGAVVNLKTEEDLHEACAKTTAEIQRLTEGEVYAPTEESPEQ